MAALPAIVRPCVDEAIARSPGIITRAMDRAGAAFEEDLRKYGPNERPHVAQAAREFNTLRVQWSTAFGAALLESIESNMTARPRVMASPSSLTFTLVDDDEVVQSIESSRLGQQIESLLDQALKELDAFMSSALELDGIQPEHNPLRPAVFAHAVSKTISATPNASAALWMRYMAEPMAEDLKSYYKTCCKMLAASNVRAAGYRVVTGPAPLASQASSPAPLEQPRAAPSRSAPLSSSRPAPLSSGHGALQGAISGFVDLAARAISSPALREFLFGSAPQAQQPLAPAYYHQVDEELAELEARWDEAPPDPQEARRFRHLPAVDRPAREVGTDSPLSNEVWGAYGAPRQRSLVRTKLRRRAQQVGQVMGLEVVNQLIGQVAQDPRLLAPVRESMVALEPSLSRLAMHSPRFFAEQRNPARQLLEAVAQRSFKFNDEFSGEFQSFFTGVTESFNALNSVESLADAQPFESQLAHLTQEWAKQDQAEEGKRQRIVDEVTLAEKRQTLADSIAWDLSQRSDLEGVPSVVQEFLFGPWTLVIAHARMTIPGNSVDPGGYTSVITDLIWTTKRESALRDPAGAFEAIPRVLLKLREGLDMLGQSPVETDTFFRALERLHRPIFKLRAKHRGQAMREELAAAPIDDDLRPAPAQKPRAREELWLRHAELRACGFEDTMPSDHAQDGQGEHIGHGPTSQRAAAPESTATSGATPIAVARMAGPALSAMQADSLIDDLKEGSWVDLFSKQNWRRARLSWASANRQLYMFLSHGGQPHSMTRRSMQRLVVSRLLRPVDAGEVVQPALDAIVRARAEPLAA